MTRTYSDFQNDPISEKVGLVQIEAAKRLLGWTLFSGAVYSLPFEYSVIVALEDSGVGYAAGTSAASLTSGTYFLDRVARVLYLRASDDSNPNGRFLAATIRLFFSNVGVNLSNDLASGFDVEWLPLLKSTSEFGVAIDNQNQLGVAIEGAGQVEFYNDLSFWQPRFDKLYFENQRVFIYSWNRRLPTSEAKLVYRGTVIGKTYSPDSVGFNLADVLQALRAPVTLANLSAFPAARVPNNKGFYYQRRLYGYVSGHRPSNIDEVLTSYPVAGTVSVTFGSAIVSGTSTTFLAQLSPNDEVIIAGAKYSVKSVDTDLQITLNSTFTGVTASGLSLGIAPGYPRRWFNRKFLIAGHALREPVTTVASAISTQVLIFASVADLRAGDTLVVNGENTSILRISGNRVRLTTTLASLPSPGAAVKRAAITSAWLDDRPMTLGTDYTYDPVQATMTLDPLAEFNIAQVKSMSGTLAFTTGSRVVTGSGVALTKLLSSTCWIRGTGQSAWFEVLSVDSDTQVTLRTAATYTATLVGQYKDPKIYTEGTSALSCDCLGATSDGTTTGTFLVRAAQIVQDLLTRQSSLLPINTASFTTAYDLAEQRLGFSIPEKFSDSKAPVLRDVINAVNQSVFGTLYQNSDFQLTYSIISPARSGSIVKFTESDLLKFSITSDSQRIAKTSNVDYRKQEYDWSSGGPNHQRATSTSLPASFLAKSTNQFSTTTYLVDDDDGRIFANRWAFLFEAASSLIAIETKLQASRLNINDQISISHRKLYTRIGSKSNLKVGAVHSASKSVLASSLDIGDLGNAFSRCGVIADSAAPVFSAATTSDLAHAGFITDSYGMQNNDPDTFGISLIW